MLDDCKYDKIKLLHEMSSIAWFIKKHAIENAKNAGENDCLELYKTMLHDAEKNIEQLKKQLPCSKFDLRTEFKSS